MKNLDLFELIGLAALVIIARITIEVIYEFVQNVLTLCTI